MCVLLSYNITDGRKLGAIRPNSKILYHVQKLVSFIIAITSMFQNILLKLKIVNYMSKYGRDHHET